MSVSLSDNRDYMLVGHVDVSDGSYRSNISKFQFSINEGAIASVDLLIRVSSCFGWITAAGTHPGADR